MTDDPVPEDERNPLEEQLGADLDLPEVEPDAEELPEKPDPTLGDPPDSVRGSAQALVDPVGEASDDDTPRWDPRTETAPSREGG